MELPFKVYLEPSQGTRSLVEIVPKLSPLTDVFFIIISLSKGMDSFMVEVSLAWPDSFLKWKKSVWPRETRLRCVASQPKLERVYKESLKSLQESKRCGILFSY